MIIALDTEDSHAPASASQRCGSPAASPKRSRRSTSRAPDFALLDVNLGVETSFEIAERLVEIGVPFAFATGYGEQIAFPVAFNEAPKIRKPYSTDTLRAVLRQANRS